MKRDGEGYEYCELHTAWLAWNAALDSVRVEIPSFEMYREDIAFELVGAMQNALDKVGILCEVAK